MLSRVLCSCMAAGTNIYFHQLPLGDCPFAGPLPVLPLLPSAASFRHLPSTTTSTSGHDIHMHRSYMLCKPYAPILCTFLLQLTYKHINKRAVLAVHFIILRSSGFNYNFQAIVLRVRTSVSLRSSVRHDPPPYYHRLCAPRPLTWS